MKPKVGHLERKEELRRYEKDHRYDSQEQRMFFTTLWLGMACLYIWLLMSFIF